MSEPVLSQLVCPLCRNETLLLEGVFAVCGHCACRIEIDPETRLSRLTHVPAADAQTLEPVLRGKWLTRREMFDAVDAARAEPGPAGPTQVSVLAIAAGLVLLLFLCLGAGTILTGFWVLSRDGAPAAATGVPVNASAALVTQISPAAPGVPIAGGAITATSAVTATSEITVTNVASDSIAPPSGAPGANASAGQPNAPPLPGASLAQGASPLPPPTLAPSAAQPAAPTAVPPTVAPPSVVRQASATVPPTFTPVVPTPLLLTSTPTVAPTVPVQPTVATAPPTLSPTPPGTATPTVAPTAQLPAGASVFNGSLRIVDINFSGVSPDQSGEYVTIHNFGPTPVSLSGMELRYIIRGRTPSDHLGPDPFRFADGAVILINQICKIYTQRAPVNADCGQPSWNLANGNFWPDVAGQGTAAQLFDANNIEQARFVY